MAKFSLTFCIGSIFLFVLIGKNSLLALTLTRSVTVPDTPICAPNELPSITLPDDFLTCSQKVADSKTKRHPDLNKTTANSTKSHVAPKDEIVVSYGYSLEVYNVTTWDGYILTVHRIPGGPKSPPAQGKQAVYLNHELTGASDSWLLAYGDKNLAFKLVDAGYDVWLGNCRGSSYSMGHETLNSETDAEYWDFSWHEMAVGDVPAIVDKIISISGNEKILYAGYSMGTTEYFIATSLIPELNNKLIAAALLAPVAYTGHANNFLRLLGATITLRWQNLVGPIIGGRVDEQTLIKEYFGISIGDFCTPTAARCGVCDNIVYLVFGFDAPQTNYTNLPNIYSKIPNNVSLKTLVHYSQLMNSCKFRQFDYGVSENVARYGSVEPPAYNLTAITVPTYFFYGDADNLAPPNDVQITKDHMQPGVVKEVNRVDWSLWNHLDFLLAKDADTLVYDKVLQIFNDATNN